MYKRAPAQVKITDVFLPVARQPKSAKIENALAAVPWDEMVNGMVTEDDADDSEEDDGHDDELCEVMETVDAAIKAQDDIEHMKNRLLKRTDAAKAGCMPSAEQGTAIRLAMQGKTIFISGPGGTGKSFVVKNIVDRLTAKGNIVFVTAPTATAVVVLDIPIGRTLQSQFGLGAGTTTHKVYTSHFNRTMFRRVNHEIVDLLTTTPHSSITIVIDEVSMVDAHTLNKVDAFLKHYQYKDPETKKATYTRKTAFGGCQMIFVGDFAQLPPVNKDFICQHCDAVRCTCTPKISRPDLAFDSTSWKQANPDIVILRHVFRQSSSHMMKYLDRIRHGVPDKTTNAYFSALKGSQDPPPGISRTLLYATNRLADAENNRLLNKLDPSTQMVFRRRVFNKHKRELDANVGGNSLPIQHTLCLRMDAQVIVTFNCDIRAGCYNGTIGIVKAMSDECITILTTRNTIIHLCRTRISVNNDSLYVEGFPLRLAYAITIHRSQGMSIDYLTVDLSGVFENHQVYVALSRATGPEGLEVRNYNSRRITVDSRVAEFYEKHELTAEGRRMWTHSQRRYT